MFDVQKFKELIKLREETDSEYDYGIEQIRNKMISLICKNIDESIHYLVTDCTESEFSWLSEIFEDIIEKTLSQEFIDALRIVAKKYPEETKKYYINDTIADAQGRLDFLKYE